MPNRRDLFKLAAFQAMAGAAVAAKIPNATMDKGQALTFGSLQLKPGATPHPPHQHLEEEIMIITEGTGDITCDGKVTKVAPGTSMYCAAGKLHTIVNTGKTPLLFYYFKWIA